MNKQHSRRHRLVDSAGSRALPVRSGRRLGPVQGRTAAGSGAAHVPFVDLVSQHLEVDAEISADLRRVMRTASFVSGPDVSAFEREFADFCGAHRCVGVANGTDAIELILRSLGVGPGDGVIVPANSFIATAEAVLRAGATPVFVDCDRRHLLIDPAAVADRIDERTRAVIGVDLFGQIAPFDQLAAAISSSANPDVFLVEDAAHSHGARRSGRGLASGAVAAATSFYPGKNLGAYGDAGAVLTNSNRVAESVRSIANHGGDAPHDHRVIGLNSRLDSVQAVVLRAKLRRLPVWNDARVAAAARYDDLLSDLAVGLVPAAPTNDHVWHLYVVRLAQHQRDRSLDMMRKAGIGVGVHYPVPIHLTPAFAGFGHRPGDFPSAEAASTTMLSLPIHPHISDADQLRVVSVLADVVGA